MTGAAGFAAGAEWLPFLAQVAAKSTLVLLLTAGAAALLWRASAAVRHLVWCVGIVAVLALPVFAALLPAWELPLLPASAANSAAMQAPALDPFDGGKKVDEAEAAAPSRAVESSAPAVLSAAGPASAWLPRAAMGLAALGVGVGLVWLALGFWGVARIGRRAEVVREPEWLRAAHDAAEVLGLRRPVLLLRSRGPVMPATWGLLWPSVVVPSVADEWPEERRHAVLAHELAHVKRFDCLTQAMAQVACVLFWWHPAVWYAARRLRVERERACDDLVLRAGTLPSEYAAHLLEIARSHRALRVAAPAMVSMARPSHLESRLLWVLDAARARGVPSAGASALTVLLALLLVVPLAAMQPTQAAPRHPAAGHSLSAEHDGTDVHADGGKKDGEEKDEDHAGNAHEKGMPAFAGSDTVPDVDRLIELRAVGVDAQYIAELRSVGYSQLTAEQLVDLRATGVTAQYAGQMNALGWGRQTPDMLVELRAVGVTPEFLSAMADSGYPRLTAEQAVELRAVGVTPVYVAELRGAGYDNVPAGELVSLRALGVTAAYVRELAENGIVRPTPGELEGLRAVGVNGAYIREMSGLGLGALDGDALTELRALGVTPAYLRELAGAGITELTTERVIELRATNVTAAWIRELREAGIEPLTAEQLVRLKASGVDRELIESRRRAPR